MEYFGWVRDVPGRGRHSQKASCLSLAIAAEEKQMVSAPIYTRSKKGYDLNSGKAMCGPGHIYVSYAKEFRGFGLKVYHRDPLGGRGRGGRGP